MTFDVPRFVTLLADDDGVARLRFTIDVAETREPLDVLILLDHEGWQFACTRSASRPYWSWSPPIEITQG